MSGDPYYSKYLKYKKMYLELKQKKTIKTKIQTGGGTNLINHIFAPIVNIMGNIEASPVENHVSTSSEGGSFIGKLTKKFVDPNKSNNAFFIANSNDILGHRFKNPEKEMTKKEIDINISCKDSSRYLGGKSHKFNVETKSFEPFPQNTSICVIASSINKSTKDINHKLSDLGQAIGSEARKSFDDVKKEVGREAKKSFEEVKSNIGSELRKGAEKVKTNVISELGKNMNKVSQIVDRQLSQHNKVGGIVGGLNYTTEHNLNQIVEDAINHTQQRLLNVKSQVGGSLATGFIHRIIKQKINVDVAETDVELEQILKDNNYDVLVYYVFSTFTSSKFKIYPLALQHGNPISKSGSDQKSIDKKLIEQTNEPKYDQLEQKLSSDVNVLNTKIDEISDKEKKLSEQVKKLSDSVEILTKKDPETKKAPETKPETEQSVGGNINKTEKRYYCTPTFHC